MMISLLNSKKDNEEYKKYKWFYTSHNVLVVGGKSDRQNEEVIKNFLKPDYTIMHTSEPGSPFVILLTKAPRKEDLDEAAIFCGCFSKQWKLNKKNISIDVFKGKQVYKNKLMKTGTFGVNGKKTIKKIIPKLAIVIQNGEIRAVPNITKYRKIAIIKQGKLSKQEAAKQLSEILKNEHQFPVTSQEILNAIPMGNIAIEK